MTIPLLDLTRQYEEIGPELEAAATEVLRSGRYILGPEVEAFEQEAASYVGAQHGIGVSSGSDALLAALMALEIGPGDEVICPTYSFFATAGAIARLGATPVFTDVDDETLNMRAEHVKEKLSPNTRAVIVVHLFGRGADVPSIRELCDPLEIPVIEDAAQGIGARFEGKPIGSLGHIGCFSFFPSKNLGACGDGGLITCDDDALRERLVLLRNHGQAAAYEHHKIGGNFRLDAIQAALLRVKLRHLERWTEARRAHARYYREGIQAAGLEHVVRCPRDDEDRHVYHQYVIRVPKERRESLLTALQEAKIGAAVYYRLPFHRQPCFQPCEGNYPVSDAASAESIALPIFPELRENEQDQILELFRRELQSIAAER